MPDAEVKLGADTSAATEAFNDASSRIRSALDGLKSAFSGFGSDHSAVIKQAIANNANLSRLFIKLRGSAQHGVDLIGGADARSQGQIATAACHGMQVAARRYS
ncbi:MAG: hypothetical protein ACREX6_00965 [Casimicrobiaceae bacterium]